eukprot:201995_1
MASPFARIIAQVVVSVTGILGRSFVAAYSQAVQNARKGAVENAKTMTRKSKMSIGEASQVLNLPGKELRPEKISEQYQRYFDANNPDKGGSFYLQSKVYKANESLLEHLDLLRKQEEENKRTGEK